MKTDLTKREDYYENDNISSNESFDEKPNRNKNEKTPEEKLKKVKSNLILTWLLLLVIVSVFVFYIAYAALSKDETSSPFKDNKGSIHLYSLNDYHGSVYQTSEEAGLSEITFYLNQLEQTNRDNGDESLFLLSGDDFSGTIESNFNEGELLSKAFKQMHISYSALGNHEFDYFDTNYNDELYRLEGVSGMQFLSANVIDKTTGELLPFLDPYAIEPITVDGIGTINIGLLGLSTIETIESGNQNVTKYLEIEDPAETAAKYVPIMEEAGADVIIALTHLPSAQEENGTIIGEEINDLAYVEGIDAIFSAHSHEVVDGEINGIPVVQAGSSGKGLSEITINLEKNGNNININDIDGSVNLFEDEIAQGEMQSTNSYVNDQISEYVAPIDAIRSEELAFAPFDLTHDRNSFDVRPTQLGALINDVIIKIVEYQLNEINSLFASYVPILSIFNNGGIRANIGHGVVTFGDIYNVLPFGNTIGALNLTGEQIYEIFEYGLSSGTMDQDPNGNNIGALQYDYGVKIFGDGSGYDSDIGLGVGDTVKKIEILKPSIRAQNLSPSNSILDDPNSYMEISRDDSENYIVVTNDFIASGGDGFGEFFSSEDVISLPEDISNLTILDLIVNEARSYLTTNGKLITVPDYYNNTSSYQERYVTTIK